jgi:hypothetical protein
VPLCDSAFPPDSDAFAPQLVETVTLPPEAGSAVGDTEIEHVPVVVPGDVHVTLMLPFPSATAWKLELVQASDAANVGTGTAKPAEATAAASTRLMVRSICMVYLEMRRRRATSAQSKPCAIYRML